MRNAMGTTIRAVRSRWMHVVAVCLSVLLTDSGLAQVKPVEWSPHGAHTGCRMNLGPTGVQVWIRGYQFQVMSVDAGSPADGLLYPGDLILGVGATRFSADTDSRMIAGHAIGEAEASDGRLVFAIRRDGSEQTVTVPIAVVGAYALGWPYGCAKSQRILHDACTYVREAQFPKGFLVTDGGIGTFHGGLLLLASGDARFLDSARRAVYATEAMALEKQDCNNWGVGYGGLLLAEYYLATGDRSVLGRLQELVKHLEQGQMRCGSWGHSTPWGAYGAMNQAGVVCTITLVLARECGLEVDPAVLARALKFYGQYAELGAVPYGDHMPGVRIPDDNGKSASTAVLCSLVPEWSHATDPFAQSVAMSYWLRETGHTGGFFSIMWGTLAARLSGQESLQSFMDYQDWYYNLSRTWRGALMMLPYVEALTRFDDATYTSMGGEFTTGGMALTFALPHRRLRILGAPRSVFGATLPEGPLREARDAFQACQWDAYHAALALAEKMNQPASPVEQRWLTQLRDAKAMRDASTSHVVREINNHLVENDPYLASEQYAALKRVLGDEDPIIQEIDARFSDGHVAWVVGAGQRYYDAWNGLRAFAFQSWFPYGKQAKAYVGDVPVLRPRLWEPLLATSPDAEREWSHNTDAGTVSWTGTFTVDRTDLDQLRIQFRSPRNAHTQVFLNDERVASIMRGQRSGYARIPLDTSATTVLQAGGNELRIVSTSVGSGANTLDIGLDGVWHVRPLAETPAWASSLTDDLPDAQPDGALSAVLAHARSTFAQMPIDATPDPAIPERLRLGNSHSRFRAALEAACDRMDAATLKLAMRSPVAYWRYLAANSLAGRGDAGRTLALEALEDPDWRMRQAACDAIAGLSGADGLGTEVDAAVRCLTHLLSDSNAWVRCRAASALGVVGKSDAEAAEGLLRATIDEHPWVRTTALGAIKNVTTNSSMLVQAACGALMIPDTSFATVSRSLPLIGAHAREGDMATASALASVVVNPGEGMNAHRLNEVMEELVKHDATGTLAATSLAQVAAGGRAYDRLRGNPRKRAIELLGTMGPKATLALPALEAVLAGTDAKENVLREAATVAMAAIVGSDE